jgi:hypothetical protein
MIGSLRVGRRGASSKIGFDHVGEDGARLGDVEWSALADRFAACKLVLHPEKTRIVYRKDANRRGDFPNQSFDFLGYSFRARKTMWQGILPAYGFMPAASPKALTAISRRIRRWTLHQRSDKSLQDLANMYNPYIGAGSTTTANSIERS